MQSQRGYSLVELVITIVFVGIAFPGIFAFFSNTMDNCILNEVMTQAIILAEEKMEEITADKMEDTRGIAYIKTGGQYPAETIGLYNRTVTVTDTTISSVDGVHVVVAIAHPLISTYSLTNFFTSY